MGGRPSEQTVEHSGSHFKWAADHLPERDFPVSADLVRSTATRLITCENSNCRYGLPAGFASIRLSDANRPNGTGIGIEHACYGFASIRAVAVRHAVKPAPLGL